MVDSTNMIGIISRTNRAAGICMQATKPEFLVFFSILSGLVNNGPARVGISLIATTTLLDLPVSFSAHKSFNQCQGVITCNSNSFILTFGTPTLSYGVKVGWLNGKCTDQGTVVPKQSDYPC